MSDSQLVLALYRPVAGSPLLSVAVAALAQGGPIVLVLLVALVWWWPGPPVRIQARRQAAVAALVAAGLAVLAVGALAHLVERPRPFVALGFSPVFPHDADSSFPSDHTLLGVALAMPLVVRRVGAGWLALLVALGIGLARVAAAVHYPSDVLASAVVAAVLGVLASWLVAAAMHAPAVERWFRTSRPGRLLAPLAGAAPP